MKKKRRLLVALAVAACLAFALPTGAAAVADSLPVTIGDAAKASVDVSWYTSDPGQEEYVVNTPAKLRGLAALVNGTAKDAQGKAIAAVDFKNTVIYQTASIKLSEGNYVSALLSGYTVYEWTPIGTAQHPFRGTYQATQGSTIEGMYLSQTLENAGLFGYCGAESALVDVSMRDGVGGQVTIATDTARIKSVGSLVGYTAGTVSGCYSDMDVTVASNGEAISTEADQLALRWVGGVAGYVLGNLSNTSFGGTLEVGVASNAPAADTTSDSLKVADAVGGVVGRFGDPDNHGTITGCTNQGTVYTHTSGIAGEDRFGTATFARIFFVGGIVGYSNGSIYNCTNGSFNSLTGAVTGIVSTSSIDGADGTLLNNRGADETGGICGGLRSTSDVDGRYNDGTADDPMIVYNCHNVGHVTGTVACGGIVGEAGSYCTVSCCSNGLANDSSQSAGKIISTRWNKPISAGILGEGRGSSVNYCANYAEIRNIQTGYYMAGICGALFISDDNPALQPELYSCYNTGGIFTINTSTATEYREAGICGQNEGYVHDCLNTEGTVPYHGNAIIGANDWGRWSNLEVWSLSDMKTGAAAAYLNAMAAQNQDWDCYWFINGSGVPTLNVWTTLTDADRTELKLSDIASIECIEKAPFVGTQGGSLPTLKVTLKSGKVLAQNADFYVVPQTGAYAMSEGGAYKASIGGLGMYRGYLESCASYDIGATDLSKANMVIEPSSYNGGRVILPTSISVRMGTSEIDASEYDYIIYSKRVSNTAVANGQSGCTEVYDSLGYISYKEDGSDKVAVSAVGVAQINSETRAYWLWNRSGEKISSSDGRVYYTATSGGGTSGAIVGENESCVNQRTGSPAGYVVKAQATAGNTQVEGYVLGNYTIDPVDLFKDCTFTGVECNGMFWYWDDDEQAFYTRDAYGRKVAGMPKATFTGTTIEPAATISCVLADGTTYSLQKDIDYRVISGDPDAEETYQNRNVTNYDAEEKVRACMTLRPLDTNSYSNYIVAFFGIAPADFAACDISISAEQWAYTGKAVEPEVTVSLGGVTLVKDVDYTVTYKNNTNKGTASYTVTALDNLKGGTKTSYTGTFTIAEGQKISDLTVDDIPDQQYNYGYDVHPQLTFRNASGTKVVLTEGVNYEVSYSTKNVTKCTGKNPDGKSVSYQATKCTATINGIGLYSGSLTKEFDIVPYDATANATNQLRATLQSIALSDWKNETSLPYNVGLKNPIVNVKAYPIVDWAAYERGDYDAAYGTPVVIGNANNANYGSTMNNRPARYYVYDAAATGNLGTLVSCDGATISSPYETGSGTTLATQKAPANTTLIATVGMRVSTNSSGLHNGAIGLLRTDTFEVSAPVSVTYNAGQGSGSVPTMDDQAVDAKITLPAATGLTRSGYDFSGWLCSVDSAVYAAGDSYTIPHVAGPITFTAQWTKKQAVAYAVTFAAGASGVSGTLPTSSNLEADAQVILPDPTASAYRLTKSGYSFAGWTCSTDATTVVRMPGSAYTMQSQAVTFTATWVQNATSARTTITSAMITAIANQAYTGKALSPAVVVKNGTTKLVAGTDFWVSYSDNVELGTAKALVYGIGSYQGSVEVTFTIQEKPAVKYGDVNSDGKVNAADSMLVARYASKLVSADKLNLIAADVNGDNKVNAADSMLIARYASKLINRFPVEG